MTVIAISQGFQLKKNTYSLCMKDRKIMFVTFVKKLFTRLVVSETTYRLCMRERKNIFVKFVTKVLARLLILEDT